MAKSNLTNKQAARLEEFLAVLNLFDEKRPNLPIGSVRAFVMTALHEHERLGTVEIGNRLGLQSGTITRHLGDWGRKDRHGNKALNYIEGDRTEDDRRRAPQVLTPGGKAFLAELLERLKA